MNKHALERSIREAQNQLDNSQTRKTLARKSSSKKRAHSRSASRGRAPSGGGGGINVSASMESP